MANGRRKTREVGVKQRSPKPPTKHRKYSPSLKSLYLYYIYHYTKDINSKKYFRGDVMGKTKSAYEQMKLEFNRPSTREELAEKLGCVCANCGSDLDIEYHHIVPLKLGGSNRLTNIAPLCCVCHKIAHGAKNIRRICRAENSGRPRNKIREDYKDVIKMYLTGVIDRDSCQKAFGFSGAQKITDMRFFKEYLQENNIVRYRNLLGRARGEEKEIASYIVYGDGSMVEYLRNGSVRKTKI